MIGLIAAFIIAMALSVMGTPLLIRFLVLHHYGQLPGHSLLPQDVSHLP